jgi:hypothetical protein
MAENLKEELADIAGLTAAYEWYLAHGDIHGAGQTAESIIMSAQHVVAVHGDEFGKYYHQTLPLSATQVVGVATGLKDAKAFWSVLHEAAEQGRLYSPGSPLNPPARRPPPMLDCTTIDGETDCLTLTAPAPQ